MRGPGKAAYAATIVREGQLRIRAIRVGSGTTAGQIAQPRRCAGLGSASMTHIARAGILIKSGGHMERLATIGSTSKPSRSRAKQSGLSNRIMQWSLR